MKKQLLAIAVCGITAASMLTACGKTFTTTETSGDSSSKITIGEESSKPAENVEIMNYTAPQNGDTIVEINFKDYGTVKLRLFPEYAERACENFTQLIEKGYYDGLTFHRIIKDFMIQGGDPAGNGTGGESVWGGKFDGGVNPALAHVTGALAYANSGSTATNGSQFYIVTGEQGIGDDLFAAYEGYGYSFTENQKAVYKEKGGAPFLDGNYTVFGQVIDGLDVIFNIQYTATDSNDKPLEDVVMESVKLTKYNGEPIKWTLDEYNYSNPLDAEPLNFTAPKEGDEIVVINFKDYGTVKFRVFPEVVSKASENFLELAKSGYYDGLTFHRIIKDFMIQGGDPQGTGMGGESTWGGSFDGGKAYNLIHAAGAVAYANSGSTATNGSQFYIVTGEIYDTAGLEAYAQSGLKFGKAASEIYTTQGGTPFLDGNYTVFGQVIDGLDVVFEIQETATDENDKPLEDVVMESVTVEEYDGSEIKFYLADYVTADEDKESETEDSEETTAAPEEETEAATEETTEETSEAEENTENTEENTEETT
ncbi:MAG: peptidylprolyl isomerase [Ruminococcus sp.]|nr:peptidylprolyl isomerase [Ruminococcus sp.]